jgi:hypothetical protein
MSILSITDYVSAAKQTIHMNKALPAIAGGAWGSGWIDVSGGSDPATAGIVVLTSTASGTVPTNSTAGAPSIVNFSGVGYISRVEYNFLSQGAGTCMLVDRLFECGTFAFASGLTTLASQPSYSGRIPGGDYTGTMLAVEQSGAGSGPTSVTITYTNQSGVTGQSTGVYTLKSNGGQNSGCCVQFVPLAAGDSGIQKVESVTVTGGSSGNVNVLVLRPLARFGTNNYFSINEGKSYVKPLELCGMRIIYPTSCLQVLGWASSSTIDLIIEVVSA